MKIKLPLIAIIILALTACDKKTDNISLTIDTYPMNVGTEWTYNRQAIVNKYESETSDKIIDRDTINYSIKVLIEKDTVLNDTMNVKIFKYLKDDNSWTKKEYKYIDDEGLKNYAYYINENVNFFDKKSNDLIKLLILNFYQKSNLKTSHLLKNEIITENKPALDIKFPLSNNSSWTYKHQSDIKIFQIDKEVVGAESLNLLGQNFSCLKVHWNYLYDSVFDGIEITDWISDKGLIKSLTENARFTLVTQDGEPLDGSYQITQTLTLKELKIK